MKVVPGFHGAALWGLIVCGVYLLKNPKHMLLETSETILLSLNGGGAVAHEVKALVLT